MREHLQRRRDGGFEPKRFIATAPRLRSIDGVDPVDRRPAEGRSRVLLAIQDIAFHQEVLDFLGRNPRSDVARALTQAEQMSAVSGNLEHDVVVMCPTMARHARLNDREVRALDAPVLVVAEEMTVPVLREAIEVGASGVFLWPEEREDLKRALDDLASTNAEVPSSRGRVIAVCGSRGGAGCTFVATHLAAALAGLGISSVLVDFDLQFSDVWPALGIPSSNEVRTLRDLVPVTEELSPRHVEDALYAHPRGFRVLLAPEGGDSDPDRYRGVYAGSVAMLAGAFTSVVLHIPRSLDAVARVGIELADEVLLVTAPEVFALYGAKRAIRALRLDQKPGKWRVVVNRSGGKDVAVADIERALKIRPCATIRFDAAVTAVQRRGELLPERSRRAGKDVIALAQLLAKDMPSVGSSEEA